MEYVFIAMVLLGFFGVAGIVGVAAAVLVGLIIFVLVPVWWEEYKDNLAIYRAICKLRSKIHSRRNPESEQTPESDIALEPGSFAHSDTDSDSMSYKS